MLDHTLTDEVSPEDTPPGETLVLGLLCVGGETIGIEARNLAEVAPILSLNRMISDPHGALGSILIRGALIPVCDPLVLCGSRQGTDRPSIAAVVTDRENMVALGVEGIGGLRRCHRDDIQSVGGFDTAILDGRTVHILDAEALLRRGDVPKAAYSLRRRRKGGASTLPYLTFTAGGATFAVNATQIYGSVPRRDVDDTTLAAGAFIGLIRYFSRRIPIVDTCRVLGMGGRRESTQPEIVVLRFAEDRLVGLAVDKIRRIEYLTEAAITPIPDHFRRGVSMLHATVESEGERVFLVDSDLFLGDADLNTLARMSDPDDSEDPAPEPVVTSTEEVPPDVISERVRYLIFTAGVQIATPMVQIVRIIEVPEKLTACASGPPGLMGMFFVDGLLTPLIRCSDFLRQSRSEGDGRPRVLLVGPPGRRVGFLVDSVDGIATSQWRSSPEVRLPGGFDLVQLRVLGKQTAVNRIELEDAVIAEYGQDDG